MQMDSRIYTIDGQPLQMVELDRADGRIWNLSHGYWQLQRASQPMARNGTER